MYKVVSFGRLNNDVYTKVFDKLSIAKEHFEDIADDIEYTNSFIRHVVLYCGHIKLTEFRCRNSNDLY
jgi:hypothetical protein